MLSQAGVNQSADTSIQPFQLITQICRRRRESERKKESRENDGLNVISCPIFDSFSSAGASRKNRPDLRDGEHNAKLNSARRRLRRSRQRGQNSTSHRKQGEIAKCFLPFYDPSLERCQNT